MSVISQLGQATANHTIEKVALEIGFPDSWNLGAGALGAGALAGGQVAGSTLAALANAFSDEGAAMKAYRSGSKYTFEPNVAQRIIDEMPDLKKGLKLNRGRIGKSSLIAALLAGLVPSIVTNSKS
jgi:hypothetical protein